MCISGANKASSFTHSDSVRVFPQPKGPRTREGIWWREREKRREGGREEKGGEGGMENGGEGGMERGRDGGD